MASVGELGRLTDEESADLLNRVERFQAAWKPDGTTGLEWYLPAPGTRHRPAVLVQVIIADMERRAPVGLPFRVERYVNLFPEELSTADMPVPLLAAEFRLRHRYTDRPPIAEYQRWFPAQFDELVTRLAQMPPLPYSGPGDHTPVTAVNGLFEPNSTPGMPRLSTLNDGRRGNPPGPSNSARPPAHLVGTGPVNTGEVAAANAAARADQAARGAETPSDVLPSDTPYQLVRRLGSGAFGEVFEALAPGGVKVAVKRILRSVDHPASQSEREALDAIKELSHPFLLKTNAYWVFGDKLVIVMELADGSLTDRVVHHQDQGLPGIPPEELIPFFEQAGEALDYLHSQNVSHRDIKPENLLVLKGYAKVADFGLARFHEHTMTLVPNTVGTPAYMAPEMWQQKVSLQSDQYSLAATYVRARTGRHLYETNVLVDMANFHIHATPNLDPLPKAEQAVLLKALAKKPEDRFSSCLEFAKALRLAVFPPPPPPPTPKPVRESSLGVRGMVLVAVACALASALAVGLVIKTMIPAPQPKEQQPEKEKEKEKTKDKDTGSGQPPVVVLPKKRLPNNPIYPEGWSPVEEAGTHSIAGKDWHAKLTRKSGGQTLTALLIYGRVGVDNPFYMLEYKITNKVFATEWNLASQRDPNTLSILTNKDKILAPGLWRYEDGDKKKPLLVIDSPDVAELPVLGVTLPEALFVADQLGGKVPMIRHWKKAIGLRDGVTVSPAGEPLAPPKDFPMVLLPKKEMTALLKWKWETDQLRDRQLALGYPKALPVTDIRASGDVSVPWGVRQLVSNGPEWLAERQGPDTRVTLDLDPLGEQLVYVIGVGPEEHKIFSLSELNKQPTGQQDWTAVEGVHAGFRIILEVSP